MKSNEKNIQEWLDKLYKWDGIETDNSRESSLFETWYFEFSSITVKEIGYKYPNLNTKPIFLLNILKRNDDISCTLNQLSCIKYSELIFENSFKKLNNIPQFGELLYINFNNLFLTNSFFSCFSNIFSNYNNIGGTGNYQIY
jgi:hypothetical protein